MGRYIIYGFLLTGHNIPGALGSTKTRNATSSNPSTPIYLPRTAVAPLSPSVPPAETTSLLVVRCNPLKLHMQAAGGDGVGVFRRRPSSTLPYLILPTDTTTTTTYYYYY